MKLNSFPHYLQLDAMDCGPSCLRMIAKYYGKSYSLQTLRARSFITREGVSMLGISDAAHFSDVLAQSAASANTNVSMMGESFKYVAPIAGAMKYSVEDTSLWSNGRRMYRCLAFCIGTRITSSSVMI